MNYKKNCNLEIDEFLELIKKFSRENSDLSRVTATKRNIDKINRIPRYDKYLPRIEETPRCEKSSASAKLLD